MFHKITFMQPLIDFPGVHVLYAGGWGKKLNPTASMVCFSIDGCQIAMASHHFKKTASKVINNNLYEELDIGLNCDLSKLEHGTDKDIPAINMPQFLKRADEMHDFLQMNKTKSVLVNCNNGRSRTGTLVALYLMKYHHLPPDEAMSIVTAILRFRGITKDSINIHVQNKYGNYGDWLRNWAKENQAVQPATHLHSPKRFFKKRSWDKDVDAVQEAPLDLRANENLDESSPKRIKRAETDNDLNQKPHVIYTLGFFSRANQVTSIEAAQPELPLPVSQPI